MFLENWDCTVAACAGPSDGRKEKNDPKNNDLIIVFMLFLVIFGSVNFCVVFLVLKFTSNEGIPNKPVNKGSNGSFIVEFNVKKPKAPERRKTVRAIIFLFCLSIRKKVVARIRNGIIGLIEL